jgi:outer membrane phospholipase A
MSIPGKQKTTFDDGEFSISTFLVTICWSMFHVDSQFRRIAAFYLLSFLNSKNKKIYTIYHHLSCDEKSDCFLQSENILKLSLKFSIKEHVLKAVKTMQIPYCFQKYLFLLFCFFKLIL